jgi:putative transposase
LLTVAHAHGWNLHAWAVFSKHNHFIADSPANGSDASSLAALLREWHGKLSLWINRQDATPGRQVWHQASYLARLHYVHANALKHGLVAVASQYPWCSASWFERMSSEAGVKRIYDLKIDTVRVVDDFQPIQSV